MHKDNAHEYAMIHFHFAAGIDTPRIQADNIQLIEPAFAANITFTSKFCSAQCNLQKWLEYGEKVEEERGHMRILCKVRHFEESAALNEMLNTMCFELDKESGQEKFLSAALQTAFGTSTSGLFPHGHYVSFIDITHCRENDAGQELIPHRGPNAEEGDGEGDLEMNEEENAAMQVQHQEWYLGLPVMLPLLRLAIEADGGVGQEAVIGGDADMDDIVRVKSEAELGTEPEDEVVVV